MQIVYSYLTEESKKEKTPEETEVYPFLILQEMRSEMCRWLSLPPPLKSPQRQFASLDATPRKSAEGNTTFPRDNTIQLLAQSPSSERLSLSYFQVALLSLCAPAGLPRGLPAGAPRPSTWCGGRTQQARGTQPSVSGALRGLCAR